MKFESTASKDNVIDFGTNRHDHFGTVDNYYLPIYNA